MANDLTGNPYLVDTAAVITKESVSVIRMVWESPTTAAHTLDVVSNDGSKLWSTTAIAGGTGIVYEREFGFPCSGINVVTIQSGTLYVYVR